MRTSLFLSTMSRRYAWLALGLICLLSIHFSGSAQGIRYVKQNGSGDGSSWANASGNLQSIINTSLAGTRVWVASGEYQPAAGQSFTMKEDVEILGGFPPTGNPSYADRNYAAFVTTLKGNGASVVANNANFLTNEAILDGFTITGGLAGEGGGIYNNSSSPFLRNLVIKGNTATSVGGGIYVARGSMNFRLENALITGNTAAANGGGIYALNVTTPYPTLTNVTITGNTAASGGGLTVERSGFVLQNSIVWNNRKPDNSQNNVESKALEGILNIQSSLVQGSGGSARWNSQTGNDNGRNIDADPLFTDAANGNFTPSQLSPAVNAGDVSLPQQTLTKDLAYQTRVYGGQIDMGAYENQQVIDAPVRYVKVGGNGDGYSWATASGDLQAMINESRPGNQVWVAAGEYKPATSQSLKMKEGVEIYGGFPATGNPVFTDRNYAAFVTTLKGNGASVVSNNSNFLTNAAILDGFIITGGLAGEGGGIYNNSSSPLLRNLVIKGNTATSVGGGIYVARGSMNFQLQNTLITGNTAAANGGGIYSLNVTTPYPTLTNVTITSNTAASGGGLTVERSGFVLQNSIVWNNRKPDNSINNVESKALEGILNIQSSLVQGSGGSTNWNSQTGNDKGGNIDADPLFIDAVNGIFTLSPKSPAVNAGTTTLLPNAATMKDLAWNDRLFGNAIDMGAFENPGVSIRYVRQGGTGDGYSWATASGNLQAMINESDSGNQVWVAEGEYQPNSGQAFTMKEGVKIWGGFSNTGNPSLTDRNWQQHTTTLKGNGNSIIRNDGNRLTNMATLDGFTLTGGSAENGGAIYNKGSFPLINHCRFLLNVASRWGGALYSEGTGKCLIVNSLFYHNRAESGGAAFNNLSSVIEFINVTISDNTASQNGGAIHNYQNGKVWLYNSIIWNNKQLPASSPLYTLGPGVIGTWSCLLEGGENAIIGDKTVSTSSDQDPIFKDAANGDFSLLGCSPAINYPTYYDISGMLTFDLAGNVRPTDRPSDAGAYQYQGAIPVGLDRLATDGATTILNVESGHTYKVQVPGNVCQSMISIQSNGTSPVTGNIRISTWIDPSVQSYNGVPYVTRHYDLSPVASAETATARISLYFTQQEFDAYNSAFGINVLPTTPTDDARKANVRIFQYHGLPEDGKRGPAAYNGSPTTLTPDLNWNDVLERWELSFDVRGFSGFFVGSASAALPVKLVNFKGSPLENLGISLEWQVAKQENMAYYSVEYSLNGRQFTTIGKVNANESAESHFQYLDAHILSGEIAYYRLRMVDLDGSAEYSRVISVVLPEDWNRLVTFPVPATNYVWIKGNNLSGTYASLFDIHGHTLMQIPLLSDLQRINIADLTPGVYVIRTSTGRAIRFSKQ